MCIFMIPKSTRKIEELRATVDSIAKDIDQSKYFIDNILLD